MARDPSGRIELLQGRLDTLVPGTLLFEESKWQKLTGAVVPTTSPVEEI